MTSTPSPGETALRLQEIGRLQDRLDQREAELAAFTAMARLRNPEGLREQARPLLREMSDIIGELERLILDEVVPVNHRRDAASLGGAWRGSAHDAKRAAGSSL